MKGGGGGEDSDSINLQRKVQLAVAWRQQGRERANAKKGNWKREKRGGRGERRRGKGEERERERRGRRREGRTSKLEIGEGKDVGKGGREIMDEFGGGRKWTMGEESGVEGMGSKEGGGNKYGLVCVSSFVLGFESVATQHRTCFESTSLAR